MTKTKKLVLLALLTAVSLVLFVIEAQMPPILYPMPGIKIGLANTVTLFILHKRGFTAVDALLVVVTRVLLAALVTGTPFSLLFSLSGGIAAVGVMLLYRKVLHGRWIPITSVMGAIAHNITQITVAVFVSGRGILLFLPVLILGAIASGLITGFAVAIIVRRRVI